MEEEQVYLEEILRSDGYDAAPITYRDRLLNALYVLVIALGIALSAALMAIGAVTVWLDVLFNS